MIVFVFVALSLTAYRATRLLIKDTFPPVLWLRDNLVGGWRPMTEPEQREHARGEVSPLFNRWQTLEVDGVTNIWIERRSWSPYWLAELLSCPWCASAYISGVLVAVTDLTYGLPVPWLQGPAVWAVAAWLSSREWA